MRKISAVGRRADDAARNCDCNHPGAGDGAGRSAFCRLGTLPRHFRGQGHAAHRPGGAVYRTHRSARPADSVGEAAGDRGPPAGRAHADPRPLPADRVRPRCTDARRASGRQRHRRRAGTRRRSRQVRAVRLAGAGHRFRSRHGVDRPSRHRRRPCRSFGRGERRAGHPRKAQLRWRRALPDRPRQGRRRVRDRRAELSVSGLGEPPRGGQRGQAASVGRSGRPAAHGRPRRFGLDRARHSAFRGDGAVGPRICTLQRRRRRPLARHRPGARQQRGGGGGKARVPIRPGGARGQASRRRQSDAGPKAGAVGDAVGDAGRSRSDSRLAREPSGASRRLRCAASGIASRACSNRRSQCGWPSAPRRSRSPVGRCKG